MSVVCSNCGGLGYTRYDDFTYYEVPCPMCEDGIDLQIEQKKKNRLIIIV